MSRPVLDNRAARRLFLHRHLLGDAPKGPGKGEDLLRLITSLGFVQVDSVSTVERAHHMILFARRPAYRPKALHRLIEKDRALFEPWTHDASIIPTEVYRYWPLPFDRSRERLTERWRNWQGEAYRDELDKVRDHVEEYGPVRSSDLLQDEDRGQSGGWWNWHPSKAALEFLWRTGELVIAKRQGFQKFYDLPERAYPVAHAEPKPTEAEAVDWFCNAALDRLGFATSGEIAAFWATVSPAEAKDWAARAVGTGGRGAGGMRGRVETAQHRATRCRVRGRRAARPARAVAHSQPVRPGTTGPEPGGAAVRVSLPDRDLRAGGQKEIRLLRLSDPRRSVLNVTRLWLEPGVRLAKARISKLRSELDRMARLVDCTRVAFADDWLR